MSRTGSLSFAVFLLAMLLAVPAAHAAWGSGPKVGDSKTTKKLESLPRRAAEGRKVVTIYRFRSAVPELQALNATDMFTTALVKSGAFTVVERQMMNEVLVAEKQLNSQGLATGDSSEHRLVGADYIFEGAVTEANASESKTGLAGTIRGLGLETSGESAQIGLDIRVIDAKTGVVLDSVNVTKSVKESGFSVSGVGSFVQSFAKKSLDGGDLALARDTKEGADRALRECIEEAVYELVMRYSGDGRQQAERREDEE